MFNVADLDHAEDRLCVTNCLLWLKLLHDGSAVDVTSFKSSSPPRSARTHRASAAHDFQQPQYSQRGTPSGVTKLMQECTVLLKAKMSYSSNTAQMTPRSSDAFSFDAVGPVLESVLGGLTQVWAECCRCTGQALPGGCACKGCGARAGAHRPRAAVHCN